MVISSEIRMGRLKDDDHLDDTPHFRCKELFTASTTLIIVHECLCSVKRMVRKWELLVWIFRTYLKVLPLETSKDQLEVVHVQCQLQYEIFLLLFYSLSLRMADKLSVVKNREILTNSRYGHFLKTRPQVQLGSPGYGRINRPHQDLSFSDSDQGSKITEEFEPGVLSFYVGSDSFRKWFHK